MPNSFSANGRNYRVPASPAVLICLDGCGNEYLTPAIARGQMPYMLRVWPASPFGGVKDSGLGIKEGVIEAIKSMTTVKTFSLPW